MRNNKCTNCSSGGIRVDRDGLVPNVHIKGYIKYSSPELIKFICELCDKELWFVNTQEGVGHEK